MTKKAVFLLLCALFILIAPLLVSLGQFFFTDAKIVPVYLTHYYLSRVNTGEDERTLLIKYLTNEGYTLVESTEMHMVFTRNGEKKEVLTTDIKCLLHDGKLTTNFSLPDKNKNP